LKRARLDSPLAQKTPLEFAASAGIGSVTLYALSQELELLPVVQEQVVYFSRTLALLLPHRTA
jgi:hypothetical protein